MLRLQGLYTIEARLRISMDVDSLVDNFSHFGSPHFTNSYVRKVKQVMPSKALKQAA